MTCPTANLLRLRWYATCQQFGGMTEKAAHEISLQRQRPEYIQALDALKNHIRECEICAPNTNS
jgi:hypothetical protein